MKTELTDEQIEDFAVHELGETHAENCGYYCIKNFARAIIKADRAQRQAEPESRHEIRRLERERAAAQPAQVPLTKHEIHRLLDEADVKANGVSLDKEVAIARAIEQAHGIVSKR